MSSGSEKTTAVFPIVGYVNDDQKKMVEYCNIQKELESESFEKELDKRKPNPVMKEIKYICSKLSYPYNSMMKNKTKLKRANGCLT
eukprot:CAMPEP_0172519200 /NCGR_PEP_ID=MMETSP1066-20121228/291275_1 /TAXON_ID=671091 /ORGANISM="Coscinodiscus wailesii, Strain CCMP2513" /LENGTH=85 /DNA_ID=CAMNT_0013301739 /DNA_START=872 /DNA_END=1129 /DNA_ORIENTATION=-